MIAIFMKPKCNTESILEKFLSMVDIKSKQDNKFECAAKCTTLQDWFNKLVNESINVDKVLRVSKENLDDFKSNLMNDLTVTDYGDWLRNLKESFVKQFSTLHENIKYVYLPAKFKKNQTLPDEIKDFQEGKTEKEKKWDIYIVTKDSEIIGFSVKKNKSCTKTNWSSEKTLREIRVDPKLVMDRLTNVRKGICINRGIESTASAKKNRDELNNIFKTMPLEERDQYHHNLDKMILDNRDPLAEYFSVNLTLPDQEIQKFEIEGGHVTQYLQPKSWVIYTCDDDYYDSKGEVRTAVKLFYRLEITFENNLIKTYRIEIRIKGNWFGASPQFQTHLIRILKSIRIRKKGTKGK